MAAWTLWASSSAGQVAPTQTGQNLDVNPRVGGGGYNTGLRPYRLDSQLFVTGQVTGLSAFHGQVGYAAGDQLRTVLPSEALDLFRSSSVGLEEIVRGSTFRTEAYYRRTATAYGVRGIADGRALAGSNMPLTSHGEPFAVQRLYREATADYAGLMDSRISQRAMADRSLGIRYRGLVGPMALSGGTPSGIVAPGMEVDDFGRIKAPDGEDLARDLYELHRVDASVDVAIDAHVDASSGRPVRSTAPGAGSLPPLPGEIHDRGETRGGRVTRGMPASNQDVFMDLLVCLDQQRGGRAAPAEPPAGDVGARDGGRIVQLSDKNDVLLRGFAGSGRDLFNIHMKRARKQLDAGKFYRAASEYELALLANRSNPLARMGLCVAYFCAGEPLTASLQLRRAFAMFPALMRTRVDIKGMMGSAVLRYRLAQLERRVAIEGAKDERLLALVLAFVHRNAGNTDEAKRYALMLNRLAGNDKILTSFATFVLTGEMPAREKPPGGGTGATPGPTP